MSQCRNGSDFGALSLAVEPTTKEPPSGENILTRVSNVHDVPRARVQRTGKTEFCFGHFQPTANVHRRIQRDACSLPQRRKHSRPKHGQSGWGAFGQQPAVQATQVMASTLRTSFEVILYPTRATRSTSEFSRDALGASYTLPPRPERKPGKFRLSVTWGNEEAFTIPNLPTPRRAEMLRAEQG